MTSGVLIRKFCLPRLSATGSSKLYSGPPSHTATVEDVVSVLVLVAVDDEVLVLAVLVFELAGP